MNHTVPARGLMAAATLATCTVALAHNPQGHPLVGLWSGTWPQGATTEVTIASVDDQLALGFYCHRSPNGGRHFVFDLHPATVPAHLETDRQAIRFQVRDAKVSLRASPADPDTVGFSFQRAERKASELDLTRVDEQSYGSRMTQLTLPTGENPRSITSILDKVSEE